MKRILPALMENKQDPSDELASALIDAKHNLLRTTNIHVFAIFWQTGNFLQQQEIQTGFTDLEFMFVKAAALLEPVYGRCFSAEGLKSMFMFAAALTKQQAMLMGSVLGWDQIQLLLRVEDDAEKVDFLNLAIDESLSSQELSAFILNGKGFASIARKRETVSKSGKPLTFSQCFDAKYFSKFRNVYLIDDYLFRKADAPIRDFLKATTELPAINKSMLLFATLLHSIHMGKIEMNQTLTAQLSRSFRKIGALLTAEDTNNILTKRMPLETKRIRSINHSTDCSLSKIHFEEMRLVFQEINEELFQYLSETLSWEYIATLTQIEDPKLIANIAGIIASQKLSLHKVKSLLKSKSWRTNEEYIKSDNSRTFQKSSFISGSDNSGNDTFKWTHRNIPLPDIIDSGLTEKNISESRDFRALRPTKLG